MDLHQRCLQPPSFILLAFIYVVNGDTTGRSNKHDRNYSGSNLLGVIPPTPPGVPVTAV